MKAIKRSYKVRKEYNTSKKDKHVEPYSRIWNIIISEFS